MMTWVIYLHALVVPSAWSYAIVWHANQWWIWRQVG